MNDIDLKGKKVLMVIAPEQFRDEELFEPKSVLEAYGAIVTVACKRHGSAAGMLGKSYTPEKLLGEVSGREYDSVLVVGGMGSPEHLWQDETLHKILQDASRANRIVGGICLSGAVLAKAGVLEGKDATVYKTTESVAELRRGGARLVDKDVVVSGKTVTANGPAAAKEFGEEVAKLLHG